MAENSPLTAYTTADFTLKDSKSRPHPECDLVMKGGVTSGVVYPYAILELARAYRFRSIGGASAGAIAAGFAAAAEYARTVRDDPDGFLRMQGYCEALPAKLQSLFQPQPRFIALMRFLLRAQAAGSPWTQVGLLLATFWGTTLLGIVGGSAAMALLRSGPAGVALGALVGLMVALGWRLVSLLLVHLPREGFGLCSGLTQPGHDGPGLTDWIHTALQDIAFNDPDHPQPLTFGLLAGSDPGKTQIDLRMMTTNLSMRRPHVLPRFGMDVAYRPDLWAGLFPKAVMDHLAKHSRGSRLSGHRGAPRPEDLPVTVAVRMSLSFPFLFQAVPMSVRDVEAARIAGRTGGSKVIRGRTVWFSDGGISSNFPIHLFDALLPTRPTFALSLDDLPDGSREDGERVFFAKTAGEGVGLPVHPIASTGDFAMSVLNAAKDWQDQLLGGMPGQRERIARVYLGRTEGGLNLTMPPERSRQLMDYGRQVGAGFAGGALDFDEHRWRRTLVAYTQLERTIMSTREIWVDKGYGRWFRTYAPVVKSYKTVTLADRKAVEQRMAAFGGLETAFSPVVPNPSGRKFPRPSGRLRIVPDV